jgi:hypothetical protein
MINRIMLISLVFLTSCKIDNEFNVRVHNSFEAYKKQIYAENYNMYIYDRKLIVEGKNGSLVDKLYYNKNGYMYMYSFFSPFSEHPAFSAFFDLDGRVIKTAGSLLFIENANYGEDTIVGGSLDLVLNTAIVPSLKTNIKVFSQQESDVVSLEEIESREMKSHRLYIQNPDMFQGYHKYVFVVTLEQNGYPIHSDTLALKFYYQQSTGTKME